MTQPDVAERVGVHPVTVAKWESGVQQLKARRQERLATTLQVPIEWFSDPSVSRGTEQRPPATIEQKAAAWDLLVSLLRVVARSRTSTGPEEPMQLVERLLAEIGAVPEHPPADQPARERRHAG